MYSGGIRGIQITTMHTVNALENAICAFSVLKRYLELFKEIINLTKPDSILDRPDFTMSILSPLERLGPSQGYS